jgi:hypothetical protein
MTQALHELIDMGRDIGTNHEVSGKEEARILDELSQQFKATTGQITREHIASHTDIEDIREASEVLTKQLGHVALSELVEMMDAAVASDDPQLTEVAREALHKRFPQEVSNPGLARANIRSVRDYEKAIELAQNNNTLVSEEIAAAAVMNDADYGTDFDDVIRQSNWTVQEQRGELTDERDQRDLEKLRRHADERLAKLRREEERKKLEAKGVVDNLKFDDAVLFDPFADEDDELEREVA